MILSTIHSAKGQEWKSVYVLNVVDGCIPSDMSTGTAEEIEEERRLLYVAMTRARERLQLVVPQRFYVHQQTGMGDRHVCVTHALHHQRHAAAVRSPAQAPPLPEERRGPVAAGAGHRCGASGAGPVFLVRFQPVGLRIVLRDLALLKSQASSAVNGSVSPGARRRTVARIPAHMAGLCSNS